ncbi:hypothetical protein [Bosea massiliensis]|uniref:Uncharacterized protein n=1 Tax=Bosea massiliensis TaxID=151419 RepID=A0ABW0PBR6_9HYPH
MTKVDDLTEAQEALLLSLPTKPGGDVRTTNKLLALGLVVWADEDQTHLEPTETGRRRAEQIREARRP